MKKHPTKSIRKYNHGIASYPLEFRGYLVSEKKVCIQFDNVQCKTRINKEYIDQLDKKTGSYRVMPIDTIGTEIDILAVGIPLDLYPIVLNNILIAHKEHSDKYEDNLKEFFVDYANRILETFKENS